MKSMSDKLKATLSNLSNLEIAGWIAFVLVDIAFAYWIVFG